MNLFDTSGFPPRWGCGVWSEPHGWLHILSDAAIFGAYLAIPLLLAFFLQRRGGVVPTPLRKLLLLFIAFILFCGVTHLNEAIIFWHPIYRFAGATKLLTALVSWATVIALVPALPQLLAMRSPDAVELELDERTKELRAERDRLAFMAALVESAYDAVVGHDAEGNIISWNPAAARLYGYSEAEAQGQPIAMIIPNERLEELAEMREAFREGKRVVRLRTERLTKEGETVPVALTGSPVRRQDGTVLGSIVITTDISDLLEAEATKRRSDELFRLVVNASPNGMIAANAEGEILLANAEAERMFGFDAGALVGTNVEALVPPEARARHPEHRRAYAGDPNARRMGAGRELFAVRRDGTRFPVEIGLNPMATEQGALVLAAIVDRTEAAQRELENRRLLAIVEGATDFISWAHPDRRVEFSNPALLKVLGVEEGAQVDLERVHPAWALEMITQQGIPAAMASGSWRGETAITTATGEEMPVDQLILVHRDGQGEVTHTSTVMRDITEARAARRRLEQANAELEQFAYIASHDLQEPLRMVSSYMDLLSTKYSGQLDERADRYIHFASDGAKRMQEMVRGVLVYSRVNRPDEPKALLDGGAIVREALRNLKVAIEEANAEVTVGELPSIRGYRGQLLLLFQNALSNAIKFRADGRTPQVSVSAKREGHRWCFCVEDNGVGIDAPSVERAFLMFQRLHGRDEYEGSGIGLALSKKIVEHHGGEIRLESEKGEGTRLYFSLPVIGETASAKLRTPSG